MIEGESGEGEVARGTGAEVWPSVLLALGIASIAWLAIAAVFLGGQAWIDSRGGVPPGNAGLGIWAVLWLAMWAAITLTLAGGLLAGLGAWIAFAPRRRAPQTVLSAPGLTETQRAAVTEAERVLRERD